MTYDAFAHLPIYGLENLGFVPRGQAGAFIAERNTAPGAKVPLNTMKVPMARERNCPHSADPRAVIRM
jgi:acetyl-CoA acetyltransferase